MHMFGLWNAGRLNSGGASVETQVLVIGGGVTGTGLARDLALRGVHCIVVEARDINAGASGANNGLLHSGARYVSNDSVSAIECRDEARLLKVLAPGCIEDTGGLFVAFAGDDESYIAEFPLLCERHGITATMVDPKGALELEPALSETLIAAYRVEDAAINPFRLSLENMAHAELHGARLFTQTEVIRFERSGGRINSVLLRDKTRGSHLVIKADQVVNATGAWAAHVAGLAGITVPMVYSKGTLLVTLTRLTDAVINHLRPPADGDIVSPGGTVSLVGTTSVPLDAPSPCRPSVSEVDLLVAEASRMIPELANTRHIRAFSGVRPLIGQSQKVNARSLSRGFVVLDHEADGLKNFITITGGKLTTYRLMAERTADLVCSRLGVSSPCQTRTVPLPSTQIGEWTEPGSAPRIWMNQQGQKEPLLCECEMVPLSGVNQVIDQLISRGLPLDLSAINMRSRVGKGSCQGAFCGLRVTAHMYERGLFDSDEGLIRLRQFLERRWHGLRPILWGAQLAQEELQEALHCGLFGLDL